MSILIKGMEMPKTCHHCRMCVQVSDGDIDWHWECCLLCEKVARYATDRIPSCPLVPIPPHGRLIDADALHEELYALEYARENEWLDGVREARGVDAARVALLDAPTIIPAEEVNK